MSSIVDKKFVKKLYWDRDIDPEHIIDLLKGGPEQIRGERIDLYRRFLNTCDWYTLLKIFSIKALKQEILQDQVITRLFPEDLKDRYRYARDILSR